MSARSRLAAPANAPLPGRGEEARRTVRYHVLHDTRYEYRQPVGESRQLLRLTPRSRPGQRLLAHRIAIDPEPTRVDSFTDAFGNLVRALHLEADHDRLVVRAESWVELNAAAPPALADSPPWEAVREALAYHPRRRLDPAILEATGFVFESTHVRIKRELADYAAASFASGTPLLAAVDGLMRQIQRDFAFDPGATTVSTPVTEVFENRRGVCQDFAHLMLSCLRSTGLAARYVSGYLLTRPPTGKPRLVGADATHAWVSVCCPGHGWVDFDPTNAVIPALEHITIGWGRDFADISPLRGVILGGGGHEPEIAVTVVPESELASVYGGDELSGNLLLA